MWVKSQNNKMLLNVTSFSLEKNYGSKKKMAIVGITGTANILNTNAKVLGLYTTEAEALSELTNIEEHLDKASKVVYHLN